MRLHLPISLRRCLLATLSFPAIVCCGTASAAVMNQDVSIITYTDFGQNRGRYAMGETNALLGYIRNKEGVTITYTGGQAPYTLEHGMIDFSSQNDGGYGAALGYNWYATVKHNGVHNNTYTGNYIGEANAIHYIGIEYRSSSNNTFLHTPGNDYKITRQSKLLTDITGSAVYNASATATGTSGLLGQLIYRAGSGTMSMRDSSGNTTRLTGAYAYIVGSITRINSISNGSNGSFSYDVNIGSASNGITNANPLPFAAQAGDSGSPAWIWNNATGQYEYISALSAGNGSMSRYAANNEWTISTMDSYDKEVQMDAASPVVHIGAVNIQGAANVEIDGSKYSLYDSTNKVGTVLYYGNVTTEDGAVLQTFNGIQSGASLWKDLSGIKDTNNWYSYGSTYFNATSSGSGSLLSYADIFNNDNLVFNAAQAEGNTIIIDADVDLGIGYVRLSKAEGLDSASFTIQSADTGGGYLLNSAGYIVDEGVSLHLQLTNPSDYMREWRKIGEGALYIEGDGDNGILLNVGGGGATYLQRTGGYAAYNVLANNGAKVVISDLGQIKRDFTFGFRGGNLDMNGNSMEWNNDNTAEDQGFTIHALDESAIISNSSGNITLEWTQSGSQTWLGSFKDTESGSLKFIYNGGEGSILTLHSIHTDLTSHAAEGTSGIDVASGTLVLAGTNTVHGYGSLDGKSKAIYSNSMDWHYADTAADITIRSGATFELGSHARLTGDVSIENGGVFIMREGVQHQMEYVEGGLALEDTDIYSDYFGLKGDIKLQGADSSLKVEFSGGTTANLAYNGDISGSGNAIINTGTEGGTLTLGGNNTFSGTKEIEKGGLITSSNASLGDVSSNKWVIGEQGFLASHGFTSDMDPESILGYIDGSSSGVLALSRDLEGQLDLTQHRDLIIGALKGCTVQYGTQGETLTAFEYADGADHGTSSGFWRLGGGGGNLVVNFLLTGNNDLYLGNEYTRGTVTLSNSSNDFTGNIYFIGAITLLYDSPEALGNGNFLLAYSTRMPAQTPMHNIDPSAEGVLLLTAESLGKTPSFDLANNRYLSIASDTDLTYSGAIQLAEGADYHFGGGSGKLTVASELEAGHGLVIDGQTYSGGAIVLNNLSAITGDITVQGWKDGSTRAEGDATLQIAGHEDNVFKAGQQISLRHNGCIDINDTAQILSNLSMAEDSYLVDASVHSTGSLELNATESSIFDLNGLISVSELRKTGDAAIVLNGTNFYNNFYIDAGSVTIGSDTALPSSGTIHVAGSAALNLNGYDATNGILLYGSGNAGASINLGGSNIVSSGSIIAAEGTGILQATKGQAIAIDGSIGAANGATLKLENGQYALNGSSINAGGGTLDFTQAEGITLGTDEQSFGGTIIVADGTTLSNDGNDASFHFNTLQFDGTVTLSTSSQSSDASSKWEIQHLEGSGILVWNPNNRSSTDSSTLTFSGEGNFSGTVQVWANQNSQPALSRYVEIADDFALQNATLELQHGSYSKYIAVAVNTGNAHLGNLGSQYSSTAEASHDYIYAGEAGTSANAVPVSTREATLTLTGDSPGANFMYEFTGSIGVNDEGTTNGISLVKTGDSYQVFSGRTYVLNNLDIQKGNLRFMSYGENGYIKKLIVRGDIAITQGANLYMTNTYALGTDQSLIINAASELSASNDLAYFKELELNGGALAFSAESFIHGQTNTIKLGSALTAGENAGVQTIRLFETSSLETGSYTLARVTDLYSDYYGTASPYDWGILETLGTRIEGLPYMNATCIVDGEHLKLSVTEKDGYFIWKGTEAAHSWSASEYGTEGQPVPGSGDIAVFTDIAEKRQADLDAPLSIAGLYFDTANDDYTLTATSAENSLSVSGTVTQHAAGSVTIDARLQARGILVEQGSLKLKQAATAENIAILSGGTLEIAGLEGVATLDMGGDSTLRFSGPSAETTVGTLALAQEKGVSIDNGTLNVSNGSSRSITGDATFNLLNGATLDDRQSSYRLAGATLNLAGNGALYADSIHLSDQAGQTASCLNVGAGAQLIVTGGKSGADGSLEVSYAANGGNEINISGIMTSNAILSGTAGSAAVNVQQGGVLNLLQGLSFESPGDASVAITVGSGARLNAAGGAQNANLATTLMAGSTLGAIGQEASFSNNFQLIGSGKVTLDTHYSLADSNFNVTQGTEGGNILMSGSLTADEGTTLTLAGSGSVSLTNANTAFHGALELADESALSLNETSASILSSANRVLIGSGATLDLSSINFTTDGGNAISDSAIYFANGSNLNLSLQENGAYTIFSNGQVDGWTELTRDNITIDGAALSDRTHVEFAQAGGVSTITLSLNSLDLIWDNRKTSGTWDQTTSNWQKDGENITYANRDTISFTTGANATVDLAENIHAAEATIESGANVAILSEGHTLAIDKLNIEGTLSSDTGIAISGAVSSASGSKWQLLSGARQELTSTQLGQVKAMQIDEGATLSITSALPKNAYNNSALTGNGVIEMNLATFDNSDTTKNKVTLNNFYGTLHITSGAFTTNQSVVRGTLRMADGTSILSSANESTNNVSTFNTPIEIEGTVKIINYAATFTSFTRNTLLFGGSVYGAGTIDISKSSDFGDGGSITFSNNVDLGGLKTSTTASTTVAFNGSSTHLEDLALNGSNVQMSFNSDQTAIDNSVSIASGATMNLAGSKITAAGSNGAAITGAALSAAKGDDGVFLSITSGDTSREGTVSNTLIQLIADTSLELENVLIASGSSLSGAGIDASSIIANNATFQLGGGIAALAALGEETTTAPLTLTQTGTASITGEVAAGTPIYSIDATSLMDNVSIAGASMTLDLSAYASALAGQQLISVIFNETAAFEDLSTLTVTASTGSETYIGYYDSDNTDAPVLFFGPAITAAVPEPATPALGILALTALLARRRRRH